jgi:hypothetical protein
MSAAKDGGDYYRKTVNVNDENGTREEHNISACICYYCCDV